MEAQLEVLRLALVEKLEAKIDFKGQAAVERTTVYVLWTTGILSFVVGFVLQNLLVTMGIFTAGCLGCAILILPSYSSYNSNPIEWLPPLSAAGEPILEKEVESKKDL